MRTNLRPSARAMRLAEAGLAHARRADEAQDRLPRGVSPVTGGGSAGTTRRPDRRLAARRVLPQLLDRQVLEDAVLDLLQVVVVLVQDLRGPGGCRSSPPLSLSRAGSPATRDRCGSCRARARPAGCRPGGSARAPPRAAPPRAGRPPRCGGAARPAPPSSLLLAQLPLDGAQLLAQVVLALRLGEPLLGLGRDLPAQLAHRQLALEQVDQPAQLGRRPGPARAAPAARARSSGTTEATRYASGGDRRRSRRRRPARRAARATAPRAGGRCRAPRAAALHLVACDRLVRRQPRPARPGTARSR